MSLFSRLPLASAAKRFSTTAMDSVKASQPRRANFGINRVELLGAVGGEPKILTLRNGDEYLSFRLYTNVDYRKRDGDVVEQTEVHEVSAFGSLVNYVKQNIHKGSRVFVCGRLNYIEQTDGENKFRVAKIGAETIIVAQPLKKTNEADDQPNQSS